MTPLAILFGAVSIFLIVTGVIILINQLRNDDPLIIPYFMLLLGAIGLWLSLTI